MSAAARRARMVAIIAALVVAIAAFLPWASFLGFRKYGIEGDGQITLVLALIGLVLAWRGWLGWIGQLVPAAVVTLFGLYDVSDAGSLAAIGLYLTFLAGGAWVVGAFMLRSARSPLATPALAADGPIPAEPETPPVEPTASPGTT